MGSQAEHSYRAESHHDFLPLTARLRRDRDEDETRERTTQASRETTEPRFIIWLFRFGIALLFVAVAFSFWFLIRASFRGIDLTDEGIYHNNYRAWRNPLLTYTGAPIIFGPLFQLSGWSIPALRLAKLVFLALAAGFLGSASSRFVFAHLPTSTMRREKEISVALTCVLGSLTIYAWLPQSPGYNDLAIIFSEISLALILFWAISPRRIRLFLGALVGGCAILLLLAKWPSGICIGAGIAMFVVASGRRRLLPELIASGLAGGLATIVLIEVFVGSFAERVNSLKGSSETVLEGFNFLDTYVWVYTRNIGETAERVATIGGPILIPSLLLAMVFIRKRPVVGGVIYGTGLLLLLPWTRWKGFLTGGESNSWQLEATFPIFFVAVLGILVLELVHRRAGATGHHDANHVSNPRSLAAGLALLALGPLLQAIGSGNPMFRIAFCAGGLWAAGIATLMVVVAERGGRPFYFPAAAGLAAVVTIGLFTGLQGIWYDSFRVGALAKQTTAVADVPELRGLRVDPSTAELVSKTQAILKREGYYGKPGFSTSNGTGLAYAVGLSQPLAGMFIEEPLPRVLEARLREACRIGLIDPKQPPVVLSLGDLVPPVTSTELQRCGVAFPAGYRSFRVRPTDSGYVGIRDVGITVWIPGERDSD